MADDDLNVVGTTPKAKASKPNFKIIGAIIGIVVLALGVVAGILLVKQQQDIREKAAVKMCPQDEECPVANDPTHLWSCTPSDGGSVNDMVCSVAGRIGVCGGRQYCCPSKGASWTTNLSLCPQKTASPTASATASTQAGALNALATATATATATSTSSSGTRTSTPTSTATSTSTASGTSATSSPFPVPTTGANWPSILGIGAGVIILIFSLGLAL